MADSNALFFTCSLIEQLGRKLKQPRGQVVKMLGDAGVKYLLRDADILHCEPIEKVAEDVITEFHLEPGTYDNVAAAEFAVPDIWTVGKVYARLIEDVSHDGCTASELQAVYTSWIDGAISDYNSSFYYEPREYLAESYREGRVLDT